MILLVDNNIYIYYGSYGSYRDNSNYRDIFVKITVVIFWAIPPSPSRKLTETEVANILLF